MSRNSATRETTHQTGRTFFDRHRTPQSGQTKEPEFDPGQLEPGQLRWRRRYARNRMYMLARQYIKLRSDLLVTVNSEWPSTDKRRVYALRGKEYLELAKKELIGRRPRIYICSGLLYLAEINLAWLYEPGMLWLRCQQALSRLEKLQNTDDVTWLMNDLRDARDRVDKRWLRATLADAFEYFSQQDARLLMDDDLQVTRLRSLLWYVGTALILLVVAVPYVTAHLGQGIPGWPVVTLDQVWLTQVVSALAVSAVGAVGGIFSGLISTRDSSTTLDEYRTSMLKLALKPLVGAVASMTLYLLLSWQILTGVKVTNGGTFLLVGFLAGFSERYFLKLLRASPEDNGEQELRRRDQLISAMAVASVPSSSREQEARFDGEPYGSSTGGTGSTAPTYDPASTAPTYGPASTAPTYGPASTAPIETPGSGESSMPYGPASTAPTETPGSGESSMPYGPASTAPTETPGSGESSMPSGPPTPAPTEQEPS